MAECIMCGIDYHDENLLVKLAVDREPEETRHFGGSREGEQRLIAELRRWKKRHRAKRVIVVYEASGAGLGFYDRVKDAGFECRLLAPSCLPRSDKQKRQRNDDRDALMLLEQLRGHVLAGNNLYDVWIPDPATRDDRELVRSRLDAGARQTELKNQIQGLLKRHSTRKPKDTGRGWTRGHRRWLCDLAAGHTGGLGIGARLTLTTYLRQMKSMENEIAALDEAVCELAQSERYKAQVEALTEQIKGVGVLTAMVFLSEVGDLTRFSNRRQIASFLGICPTSDESTEGDDHKGHITHRGPWRVRMVLCQAAWTAIRTDAGERVAYDRICARNPRHKKIGVVAVMRRMSIRMWHIAMAVQPEGMFADAQKPTIRKKTRRSRRRRARAADPA